MDQEEPAALSDRRFRGRRSYVLIVLGTDVGMAGCRVRYVVATEQVDEFVEAADEKQLSRRSPAGVAPISCPSADSGACNATAAALNSWFGP
ncbi:hypothetical protein ACIQI8_44405 [Streptomyces sp. NPDC092369]|uniref:hypothetical protein n=1 Tax=Streptomyces sp. NPDC092369 TaxID=3366015 RepID=UPI0037F74B74